MAEFISVTTSSYDPAALAAKLTEKSAEGGAVVSLISSGGEIVAYLTRGGSAGAAATGSFEPRAVATTSGPSPVAEPAGWGASPACAQTTSPYAPSPQSVTPQPASASTTTTSASPLSAAGATPGASATPAGWYHDPSGRYELRYWDGSQWTEHVARGGNQYTDPPVA
ncbi:MAG: DUF2510 domain-containing protein [Ilumatobacteraceae bacterium]